MEIYSKQKAKCQLKKEFSTFDEFYQIWQLNILDEKVVKKVLQSSILVRKDKFDQQIKR